MKPKGRFYFLIQVLIAFFVTVVAHPCLAAPTNMLPENDNEWHYAIAFPVVWMPAIDGEFDIDGRDNINVEIGFNEVLEKLNLGLMGSLSAVKGDWGVGLNVNYLRAEDTGYTEGFRTPIFDIPILAPHRIQTTMHLSTNDLTLRYRVHPSIRLTTGVRHFYTRVVVELEPTEAEGLGINRKAELIEEHLFDWIFGFAADHWFNERWGVSGGVDIGIAGDNDSDFNGQAFAIYRIDQLNNVWVGYRHLRISNDAQIDGMDSKITFSESGPALGWAFTF